MKANRKLLRFCYVCADYSERLIEGKQRTWARKADDNPKMKPNIIFRVKLLGTLETNAPVDFWDKKKSRTENLTETSEGVLEEIEDKAFEAFLKFL